jgi:diguanylate cyclase (GGDEF)-like protein
VLDGLLRLSMAPGYENTWEKVFISILDITDRKRSEKKLRFMSYHDNLTGLYNRAFFNESLADLENSDQYPISVISFDLDKLKIINDSSGHDAGDRAIKGAAKILTNVFRKQDIVARVGGDEFVAILPTVDLKEVDSLNRRLKGEIENYNNSNNDDDLYRPISLSYGITTVNEGKSLLEGYKLADELMYRTKAEKSASGGNGTKAD